MCVSSDSCSLVSSIAVDTVTEEWKGRFICGLNSLSNYQRFCNFYQLLSTASQLSPSPLLKINFPFHLFCEIFSCMFGNLLRIWKACRLSKLCKIYQDKKKGVRAGEVAQAVEFLPSIHVTLDSIPALHKSGLVTPPYSPNTPERYGGRLSSRSSSEIVSFSPA